MPNDRKHNYCILALSHLRLRNMSRDLKISLGFFCVYILGKYPDLILYIFLFYGFTKSNDASFISEQIISNILFVILSLKSLLSLNY